MSPDTDTKDPYAQLEYRCPECNKLVLKGMLLKGYAEFKCLRCKNVFGVHGMAAHDCTEQYLILTTPNGVITNCSVSTGNILGYTPEELMGIGISAVYGDTACHTTDRILAARAHMFRYLRFDTEHQTKDGSPVSVIVTLQSLSLSDQPHIARLMSIKPPLQTGIKERATFKANRYSDFSAEFDIKGNIVYADQRACELSGYVPEELIGKLWWDFVPPNEVTWRRANMDDLFASHASYRGSSRVILKDGRIVEYEAFATPNYDDFGNVIGYKFTNWLERI